MVQSFLDCTTSDSKIMFFNIFSYIPLPEHEKLEHQERDN